MRRSSVVGLVVAVLALPAAGSSLVAQPLASPTKIRIQAAAKSSTTVLGEKVQITGSISPRISGVVLVLQNYVRSDWVEEGVARVRANGTFTFSAQPRARGRTSWRVVTAKGSTRAVGRSRVVTITALAWDWLNEFRSVTSGGSGWGGLTVDATTANGTHYAHPLGALRWVFLVGRGLHRIRPRPALPTA